MGGFTWNANEATSLTYHVTAGDFGDGTAKKGAESNAGNIYAHAIVLTHKLNDRVDWVIENTLGSNVGTGTANNQWYSCTGYLFVDLSDHWSAGSRLEWFRDEDGKRVDANGAGAGSYYEATLGLNWYPSSNLTVRPEVRWDWFDGQGRPFDSPRRWNDRHGSEAVHRWSGHGNSLLKSRRLRHTRCPSTGTLRRQP